MTYAPVKSLKKSRILISNDDGIEAPGLKALERIAHALSDDVWVIAPETEQSAAGHSLTLRRPLRIRKLGKQRFAVDGTPTDCVLLAINKIMKDKRPDLVLSGVNRGGNLGEDITYSGTVAAAMEGTLLGMRAMALSQVVSPDHPVKWATAEALAPKIIKKLCAQPCARNVLMNLNFPDFAPGKVKGVVLARQGKRKIGDQIAERIDPRGLPYIWIGGQRTEDRSEPGTDLNAIFDGFATVTPLCVDMTHGPTLSKLTGLFG
ncbi:MAG: 5'/3'-nucleotidase SurE [Rhodospirillales bacterium]|nr:MAG: 5'/3'-nucleotidase SurE [Rhodospirillales bacterium]